MITMKISFHGVKAEIEYSELPMGVKERNVEASLRMLAADTYQDSGGTGQELSPEVNVIAKFSERSGIPTMECTINGKEWASFLVPFEELPGLHEVA
jgi:hypothetical protein